MKKYLSKILVLACVMALSVPCIPVKAAVAEPRAAYAVCISCGQLGYVTYTHKEQVGKTAYTSCNTCGEMIEITYYKVTYTGSCSQCGYSNTRDEYVYEKSCGHNP